MTSTIQLKEGAYSNLANSNKAITIPWSEIVDPTSHTTDSIRSQVSQALFGILQINNDYQFVKEASKLRSSTNHALTAKLIKKDNKGITVQKRAKQSSTGKPIEEWRLRK